MSAVEDFIYSFEGEQQRTLLFLHHLLTKEFDLQPRFQYNLPFYYRKSWICYLFPTKKGNIELAFPRGNELSNDQELLVSKGRKMVSGIDFNNPEEIPVQSITEIIHEAILLDETIPYSFPRKPAESRGEK